MPVDASRFSPVERLLLLLAIGDFEALSPAELRRVANASSLVEHPAGTPLSGDPRPLLAVDIVVEGVVELPTDAQNFVRLGPPSVIGSLAEVLSGRGAPRAVAITDTLTLRLPLERLEDLFEEEFGIFLAVLRGLTRSLLDHFPLTRGLARDWNAHGPKSDDTRDVDLVERILLMRETLDFGVAHLEVLAELARQAVPFTRRIGGPLWRAGEPAERFLVLSTGSVHCAVEAHATVARSPVALGMLESIAGLPRRFTATAASDVRGLEIPGSLLIDLIEDYPNLGLDLLRSIAKAV